MTKIKVKRSVKINSNDYQFAGKIQNVKEEGGKGKKVECTEQKKSEKRQKAITFKELVNEKVGKLKGHFIQITVDEMWVHLQTTMTQVAKEACTVTLMRTGVKNAIMEQVRVKKKK